MTLREFRKLLNAIAKCQPEAEDANVWAGRKSAFPVSYVGFDQKHKPARVKVE